MYGLPAPEHYELTDADTIPPPSVAEPDELTDADCAPPPSAAPVPAPYELTDADCPPPPSAAPVPALYELTAADCAPPPSASVHATVGYVKAALSQAEQTVPPQAAVTVTECDGMVELEPGLGGGGGAGGPGSIYDAVKSADAGAGRLNDGALGSGADTDEFYSICGTMPGPGGAL